MLIQIDIDSTLYEADPLFDRLAREAGIDYPTKASHWVSHQEIKYLDGTPVQTQDLANVFRKAHSQEYVMQQKPYENASEAISRILEKYPQVEVAYVSDRHGQAAGPLESWLVEHDFLQARGEKVEATKDKRHWMRINKPEIVIDDRVRTILMARYELKANVIAYCHPHNINLRNEAEGIYVEDHWFAIEDRLCYIIDKYLKGDGK